jgi:hypothetical protein
MSTDVARELLDCMRAEFRVYKRMAEKSLAQVPDDALHARLDAESNSLAVVVRHVANNLRSRFTDFLTTDGEKPDRQRDREFEESPHARAELLADWEDGWARLTATLDALTVDDLARDVVIRGEPHTVVRALHRALAHIASHVGQIVLLSKHYAGDSWRTLSVPRGESDAFNAKMREKFEKARG